MSLQKKIAYGVLSQFALMFILGGATISSFKTMNSAFARAINKEKEEQTKGLVDLAYAVAVQQNQLERAGKIKRQEAQERTKDILRSMRYGENGYIWINDFQPAMIMHPIRPDMDGKDLSNYTDPTGKHIFVDFASVAKSQGSGFVPYMWPKPGQSAAVRKLSYVKAFAPWGWVIGTGIYRDDVDASATSAWDSSIRRSRTAAIAIFILLVMVGAGSVYILRDMNKTLHTVVQDLSRGAEQVASAASQVSAASQALAQGASEQAATIEESSSSAEEVNSISKNNAATSKSVAALMDTVAMRVLEGDRKVAEMVDSIQQINHSSDEISKIVKLIDEIAFQTNILALNAAVEAARAGGVGMGFAVVADEVRSLAQRCAQAAKDTAHLIERSIQKSNEGRRKSTEVTTAITAITCDVEQVKSLIHDISRDSNAQAQAIEQIKHGMEQVEQITQRNAAGAEESAAAGQQLQTQSETLRTMVAHLTRLVGSGTAEVRSV